MAAPPAGPSPGDGAPRGVLGRLRHQMMNLSAVGFGILVGGALVAYVVFHRFEDWREPAARGFGVVLLPVLPGLLYLRFVRFPLRPICTDTLKFETYYGHRPGWRDDVTHHLVTHHLLAGQPGVRPHPLGDAGVGWAGVIWYLPDLTTADGLTASLRFGFLGAYFAILSMLVRRYFQTISGRRRTSAPPSGSSP